MKNKIILFTAIGVVLTLLFLNLKEDPMVDKRKKHQQFLANSPFKETLQLTKEQRKAQGLPPNKYFEREWELTMNPELGRPTPEKVLEVQERLRVQRRSSRNTYGTTAEDTWTERGPNNIGGRTKAVLFDPNDPTNETVFAGGVSGGLWKNTNISNADSAWQLLDIPENLSVTSLKVDPNNSNTFYVGTGESYTNGDADGNGLWKSTDGGTTWSHVFGGVTGTTTFESNAEVSVNSPTNITGTYQAVQAGFGPELTSITGNLVMVNDGSSTPTEGCNALQNGSAISGNIAVIVRGSCDYPEKVENAQNAGAVAVLMISNILGPPFVQGGGSDVTIPSVMVSKEDGDLILKELYSANTVNITMDPVDSSIESGFLVPGITHINDIAIRDNRGTSEIYVTVGDSFYRGPNFPIYMGGESLGLYKSTDGGASWSKLSLPLTAWGNPPCPNDLEIGADNSIWLSSTRSLTYDDPGGGMIMNSTDGITFTTKATTPYGVRTEIAVSSTDPNKIYVLAQTYSRFAPVSLQRTDDSFATVNTLPLPIAADPGIPANDFTRGQSFYDLTIDVDPNDDSRVFVGGIDLFRSTDRGGSWQQLSDWLGDFGYQYVHADQHGVAFSGDGEMLFGTDGGVFYSDDNGTTIQERNNNYNVTKFYKVAVPPTTSFPEEFILGGTQDNGSLIFPEASSGINSAIDLEVGGDGAYCFYDQDGTDRYHITNYTYNGITVLFDYNTEELRILNIDFENNNGDFINQQALDSNLNILYSNYSGFDYDVVTGNYSRIYRIRRYTNILSGTIQKDNMRNALLSSTPSYLEVSPFTTSSTTLLIGTDDSKLLKVTNANIGSGTWTDISGYEFYGSVSDIQFGQSEDQIFVTMHNYGVNNIWYTENGGLTWRAKDGNLPDIPVKCIMQNPLRTDLVIVGTDLGVWWTDDFSSETPTWKQANNGMSNVKVTDLQLRDNNEVYAATYGRGIFSRTFTSKTWVDGLTQEELNLFPNPATNFIQLQLINNSDSVGVGYELFDSQGNLYTKGYQKVSNRSLSIDIGNLAQGVYFVKVNAEGKTYSYKFIKI